jgi:hypothetical protein
MTVSQKMNALLKAGKAKERKIVVNYCHEGKDHFH